MNVVRGTAFEACFDSGVSGQTGIASLMLIDNDGGITWPADTTDIVESPAGSGIYCANRIAPLATGQYTLTWSVDGSFNPYSVGIEDLFVVTSVEETLPPLPPPTGGGASWGPCSAWVTTDEIEACCSNLPDVSSNFELVDALELAATSASQLLWALSGRQFSGLCERKVRPCRTGCTCDWQILSRGHIIYWGGDSWYCEGSPCGCHALSRVKLSGYPVQEILEVKIDGDTVDPGEYRLDERRYLTRMNGSRWPGCQHMDLDDTEDGTFSVTYQYGQNPPQMGRDAAAQLACEVWKSCAAASGLDVGECALPTGATRVTRQGITIERTYFQRDLVSGAWRTGLAFVDAFLNSVNPHGLQRPPTFWAPGPRYARGEGV